MFIKNQFDRIMRAADKDGAGSGGSDEKQPTVSDSIAAALDAHDAQSDSNAGAKSGTSATSRSGDDSAAAGNNGGAAAASSQQDKQKDSPTSQADNKDAAADKATAPAVAPASWDAESKAAFAKLPPEMQKTIAKRESERDGFVTKSGEELATYRKRFDGLDETIKPYRDLIVRNGMTEAQYVAQLLALSMQASSDFPGFIREQAKLRNFDLKSLVASDGNKDATQFVDPVVKQLQDQISELTARERGRTNAAAAQQTQTIVQAITEFSTEQDDKGQKVRPHYERLEADMEPFIIAIRRGNPSMPHKDVLQQAYDRALWANPETRGEMVEQERRAAATRLIDEEKQRAQKASSAAVSHRGSPVGHGGASGAQAESVEDTVRNTLAGFGM